ncbi:hypothetical protein NPIL_310881, partial [Nephila pilipes]
PAYFTRYWILLVLVILFPFPPQYPFSPPPHPRIRSASTNTLLRRQNPPVDALDQTYLMFEYWECCAQWNNAAKCPIGDIWTDNEEGRLELMHPDSLYSCGDIRYLVGKI